MTGGGFLILPDFLLHPLKQTLRNNGRNAMGNHHIPKTVLTHIFLR